MTSILAALMPPDLPEQDKARFKELFWQNLAQTISADRHHVYYPQNPLKRFLKGNFLPGRVKPVDLYLDQTSAESFSVLNSVCQSIIEAQAKTCQAMSLQPARYLLSLFASTTVTAPPASWKQPSSAKKILKQLPHTGIE